MADCLKIECNDSDHDLLKKIFLRLGLLNVSVGDVTLDTSDLQIGAVEIKDANSDTRVKVTGAAPGAGDNGIVVRNIPSGTQDVNIVSGGGGGVQYAEDTPSVAADMLTMAGVVRLDAIASLVNADGDRTQLQVNSAGALRVDGSSVTQPISAASLPLPAGAATQATLLDIFSVLDGSIDPTLSAISGQLPALLVGGRLDVNVGASVLPTGAATEVTLATRLSEAAWLARTNTLGQKTMAGSMPVVIASDQSAIPITVASLPLPAGAATEATLATRLSEATFTARINTLGQKTMAASTPVVIASDQSALPITAAALPLPAGAATEATLAAVVTRGPFTDHSGTITLGGTAQTVMAANAARRCVELQNSSTEDLWVNFGVPAVIGQPSYVLGPRDIIYFEDSFIPTESLSVIGATTGQMFTSKQG